MPSLPGTYRPGHLPPRAVERRVDDRDRGSASERGYDWKWAKAAKGHLAHNPTCVGCQAEGRVELAVLVDHVEPHKGDTKKFWDKANWQVSCRWHHDVVKQKLERMWMSGTIGARDLRLDSVIALSVAKASRR